MMLRLRIVAMPFGTNRGAGQPYTAADGDTKRARRNRAVWKTKEGGRKAGLFRFVGRDRQPNMAATETKGARGGRERGRGWVMTGRWSSHRWLRTGTRRGRDEIAPYGKRRRERGGGERGDERGAGTREGRERVRGKGTRERGLFIRGPRWWRGPGTRCGG